MNEAPEVSVVIPAHNAAATLGEQLEALVDQKCDFAFEVVVVLNRCNDHTPLIAAEWTDRHAHVRHITADDIAGASHARNVGAHAALGEFLVFCDADDVVQPGWLAGMVASLGRADVVGGRLEPHPSSNPQVLGLFPVYRRQQNDGLPAYRTLRYAMTASMAIRRDALLDIGGFDDAVAHGTDDVVVCLRAQQGGLRMGFAPGAACWYRLRDDLDGLTEQRCSYTRANVAFDARYHLAGLRPPIVEGALLAAISARWALSPTRSGRARRLVHRRVQRARYEARRELDRRGRAPSNAPGTLVSVASLVPSVERLGWIRRRVQRERTLLPPIECTVGLEQPLIGGLGVVALFDQAKTIANKRRIDSALQWLVTEGEPEDLMIDLQPGVGLWTVAASLRTGRRVVTVADLNDPDTSVLRTNLDRHLPRERSRIVSVESSPAEWLDEASSRIVVNAVGAAEHDLLLAVVTASSRHQQRGVVLLDHDNADRLDKMLPANWSVSPIDAGDGGVPR